MEAAAAAETAEVSTIEAFIAALIQRVSNQATLAHRQCVVKQFHAFLNGRAPTGELALEFLTQNASPGKYKANTMWSRRSHLIYYMQHELSPPIALEPFLKSLDAALSAM